jgi:asparagine synthase (glutamine-hydrolysing)
MCGIAGIVSWDGVANPESVAKMLEVLHHRGPDRKGYLVADLNGKSVQSQVAPPQLNELPFAPSLAVGHARLSILDISGGVQPLANEDESIWVVFNGEIYNHLELRERLTLHGHCFATSHSDTEVIVHAYEQWGLDSLLMFRGMFAFAILDLHRKRLLLARDRFGVKPLYYRNSPSGITFASELSAIKGVWGEQPELDLQSLSDYLLYQYIPAPATVYRDTAKLAPGECCVIDLVTRDVSTSPYWSGDAAVPLRTESEEQLTEELVELLRESVSLRMVADVPVGAFLSGGVDSASVVALMRELAPGQQLRTFSIGFDQEEFDELDGARYISERFGTLHRERRLGCEVLDMLPALVCALDEPLADPSFLPTYLVSQMAAEDVTVALSGDGGDEAFVGYQRYTRALLFNRLTAPVPLPLRKAAAKVLSPCVGAGLLGEVVKRLPLTVGEYYALGICHYEPAELSAIFTPEALAQIPRGSDRQISGFIDSPANGGLINRLRCADIRSYLPGAVLAKVDRASMAWSLEVRSPFLDHRVHEFVSRLPGHLLLGNGIQKYLLKRAVSHQLPWDFLNRPKKGFGLPLDQWFRTTRGERLVREALNGESLLARWLKMDWIERMRADHCAGRRNAGFKLWSLLILEYWLRRGGR